MIYSISDVFDELINLYSFWLKNHEKFFNQNEEFDNEITNKFSSLLDKNIELTNTYDCVNGNKIFTALVILYDQIPRHIFRTINAHKITKYLEYIYPFVMENYCKYIDLTALELSFILLPLRHTNDFKLINETIRTMWKKIKNSSNDEYTQQYKKFLNAAYIRYSIQNSDITNLKLIIPSDDFEDYSYNDLFKKIYLDSKCWKNNKLITCSLKNHIIYQKVKDFIKANGISHGIISLSGGVDSMVLSLILNSLNVDLVAVHINYSNRKECFDEETIVINWCKHILKIPLFIRTINEINRKDCMKYEMRELYETYTKNIRFNAYRNAQMYFDYHECNVFTGHNRDDCFENIITNIANKSHRENLVGMYSQSMLSGINFIRTMLDCDKSIIYDFASIHQIPFFVDSTPKWSQRGKIRDSVRPILEKWNQSVISGLFEVSSIMKLQSAFVTDNVKELIKTQNISILNENELFKTVIKQEFLSTNPIFWKELFVQLGVFISNNSLDNFIEKIFKLKVQSLKNVININNIIILNKKSRVIWVFDGENIVFKIYSS